MDTSKVLGFVDDYMDILSDELRQIASLELREDPEIGKHSLEAFREWILKNPDILKCRLDSGFLLRFLRTKKFSIPLAQELLIKYITSRMILSDIFSNLDCLEPSVKKIYDDGVIFMLKGHDDHGRRVLHMQFGRLNPATTSGLALIRAIVTAIETLNEKEDSQICGISYTVNYRDVGIAFAALWTPSNVQRLLTGIVKSHPARHKVAHIINLPSTLNWFIKLFMRFSDEKIRKRIIVEEHGTNVGDLVPKRMLPKEFGGTECTLQELVDMWNAELLETRPRLLQLDELAVSESCKLKRETELYQNNDLGCDGSFRKLQMD